MSQSKKTPADYQEEQMKKQAPQVPAAPKTRKVKCAYLHVASRMLPGGRTESSITQSTFPGARFFWARGEGLIIETDKEKCLVPYPSVGTVYFDPSDPGV